MVKDFDASEETFVMAKQEGFPDYKRYVCPDCVDHPQMTMREVNNKSGEMDTEFDCKNLFLKDGKVVSQCNCYSMVHALGYEELQTDPMEWFCDSCEGDSEECPGKKIQNNKPINADCPKGMKPIWYAKRRIRYSTPDPRYINWLMYFGTEADKIKWDQEKKVRGVN